MMQRTDQLYLPIFWSTYMVVNDKQRVDAAGESGSSLAIRLSRNIAGRRRVLGLTQAQLAERLNVDTETLSRFERGKHLPSLAALERLAWHLQTTIASLLDEPAPRADDDALAITAWLMTLSECDRNFVRDQIRRTCHHLKERGTQE